MNNIKLDIVVETGLSKDEFTNEFVKWIESNGWVSGGNIYLVDDEGDKFINKCFYHSSCKHKHYNKVYNCVTCNFDKDCCKYMIINKV